MSMRDHFLNGLVALTAASSVVTAAVVVRKDRDVAASPPNARVADTVRAITSWENLIAPGQRIGPADAPVTFVEFADFQCPACRDLHTMWKRLEQEFPGSFAISFRHVPLDYHKRAYASARAAECAGNQGKFAEYHDALFANHAILDTVTFERLAREVPLSDLPAFASCVNSTAPVANIDRDKAVALDSIRIRGTPTVVVNGKVYPFAPPMNEIRAMLERAQKQRQQAVRSGSAR